MPVPNVVAGQMVLASDINAHINQTNANTTTINGYNNVPRDGALSSSGGNLSCNTVSLTSGSITRIVNFSGTGTASASYSLGAPPDVIVISYAGNFGTPPTQAIAWYNGTATGCNVVAQAGYSWLGLAIKF